MSKTIVQGWDLSLNHAGFVELDGAGKLSWYSYVTDKATHVKAKHNGVRLQLEKNKDKQAFQIARLKWWLPELRALLKDRPNKPTHVGIEDYALRAQSNSAYQIGEVGGIARLAVLGTGAMLRLHDPISVKMYVAHDGTAKPEKTAASVYNRWPETAQAWDGLPEAVKLDLCSAYGVARMVLDEVMLRAGTLQLSELHAKEIQVFNRVTKAYPVSLLGREFIQP